MKNAKKPSKNTTFSYISHDIKSIFSNPTAVLVLAALAILPSFYARFNILSSRDPYGNTDHIKIAVASEDEWTTTFGKTINIGENVLTNLQDNTKMGRIFVDAKKAADGVRVGDYYASIVFPKTFSKDMLSFLDDNPKKPTIVYTVNEKINAIVPKITQKGVEWVEAQIESSLLWAINEEIFKKANKSGEKLASLKKNIQKSRTLLNKIAPQMDDLHNKVIRVKKGADKWLIATQKIRENLPELEKSLTTITRIAGNAQNIQKTIKPIIEKVPTIVQKQIALLDGIFSKGIKIAENGADITNTSADVLIPKIETIQKRLLFGQKIVESLWNTRKFLDELSGKDGTFAPFIKANNRLLQNIKQYYNLLEKAKNTLKKWWKLSSDMIQKLNNFSNTIHADYLKLKKLTNTVQPKLATVREKLSTILSDVATKSKNLQGEIPRIKKVLETVEDATKKGNYNVQKVLNNRWKIENGVKKMQEFSRVVSDDKIDALLHLLWLNPTKEKNFFENLIKVDDTHLFPIPNYGSAISPFFTVLALWVGGLLAVSLLSVHPTNAIENNDYRRGYLTRLLLFVVIGIMQAIILSLGNIYFLGVYVAEPRLLVLLCSMIAIVFQTLIFSFVYLLGNIGKVVGILLLVLQLSAAGGTFPVELTKSYFVQINPYLPFTYAINAVREAVGWVVPEILTHNIRIIVSIGAGVLIGALLLAPYLAKIAMKFDKKTHDIDAFH